MTTLLKEMAHTEIDRLKASFKSDAEEFRQAAGERIELFDMEQEIHKDKLKAEAAHIMFVYNMKRDVENETKELKALLNA